MIGLQSKFGYKSLIITNSYGVKMKRTPADSEVLTRELVMPNQTNPHGTLFGGVMMSWIDKVAAMAAEKYCLRPVVTASIDFLAFKHPLKVGDHAVIGALVNRTGRTSMEVGVKIQRNNPRSGDQIHVATAYLTFIAIDSIGKPAEVPQLQLKTDNDIRRNQDANKRYEIRKILIDKVRIQKETLLNH